jgi:CRISPR-associated endoribonuclease Cas6
MLTASNARASLPINSNHAIASMIYHTLGTASAEFAALLHGEGFSADGRSFKLFTFSRLRPDRSHLVGDKVILDKPSVTLQISSPLNDFIEYFVTGLFQAELFRIADTSFHLTGAETLSAPEFDNRMSFRRGIETAGIRLSPVAASTALIEPSWYSNEKAKSVS